MNERQVQEALNESLERIAQGATVEECLARHAVLASELEPLLRMAMALTLARRTSRPSEATRREGLARAMREWPVAPPGPRWRALTYFRKPVAVAAVMVAAVVFGGWGTVSASTDTVPGDTLYPVKTTRERVLLLFTRSDDGRALRYARQSEVRGWELEQLAQRGAENEVLVTLSVRSRDRAWRAMESLSLVPQPVDVPIGGLAVPERGPEGPPPAVPAFAPPAPPRAQMEKRVQEPALESRNKKPPADAGRGQQLDRRARQHKKLTQDEQYVLRQVHGRLQRALEAHREAARQYADELGPAQRQQFKQMIQQREREWQMLLDELERYDLSLKGAPLQLPRWLPEDLLPLLSALLAEPAAPAGSES